MIFERFRRVADAVPVLADDARESLRTLDGGVRRANATMAILATVAVVALILATVAVVRVSAATR